MNIFILIPTLFGWLFLIILFTVIVRESWQYRKLMRFIRKTIYCRGGNHLWSRRWESKDIKKDDWECDRCDTRLSECASTKPDKTPKRYL